jgi:hypothetical protein
MEQTTRIIAFIFILLSINGGLVHIFDKHTKYKNSEITDQSLWFIILFAFFGIIMILFSKQIKQIRKEIYIKNKIKDFEFWNIKYGIHPPKDNDIYVPYIYENNKLEYDDYFNNKRYIKLKKIQRKSQKTTSYWIRTIIVL